MIIAGLTFDIGAGVDRRELRSGRRRAWRSMRDRKTFFLLFQ